MSAKGGLSAASQDIHLKDIFMPTAKTLTQKTQNYT